MINSGLIGLIREKSRVIKAAKDLFKKILPPILNSNTVVINNFNKS